MTCDDGLSYSVVREVESVGGCFCHFKGSAIDVRKKGNTEKAVYCHFLASAICVGVCC